MRALLAVALIGLCVAGDAWAETMRALAVTKPAPGNERRVALVIGNSAYKSAPLRNPVNDARAMATTLTETGFSVILVEDATLAGMRRAVRDFGNEIARGGVGLFYYAGHGMQIRGRNYLVPVNADIQAEDEIADQGVDAAFVMAKMDTAKNALNILILDACRNNPFARSFRSTGQGLAQMDAPTGTLIAFATAPGSVAADGDGDNGIYTKHLLEQIRKPGTPVEQLFKQVRNAVMADTKERQVPWESSSLRGDFYFIAPKPGVSPDEQQRQQKAAIDRAVTDAVKQAEDRAAKERTELQRKMEEMIQQALAKQREMQEAERRRLAASIPAPVPSTPVTATAPKAPADSPTDVGPVASASPQSPAPSAPAPSVPSPIALAPSASAPQETRVADRPEPAPDLRAGTLLAKAGVRPAAPAYANLPSAGDVWLYRGREIEAPEKKMSALVEVIAASQSGVIDRTEIARDQGVAAVQWAHGPDPALIGVSTELAVLSPYMDAHWVLPFNGMWMNVENERVAYCASGCFTEARIVGTEALTVAAGTFDTTRVHVRVRIGPAQGGEGGSQELTLWYAARAKRPVRIRSVGRGSVAGESTEFELAAYRLGGGPAVGDEHGITALSFGR